MSSSRGTEAFETDFGQPPPFDESLFDEVLATDGVDAAVRGVQDFAQLTDKQGGPITTGGAPTLAFGLDTASDPEVFARFSPLELVAGDWPVDSGEVAIDPGTADDEGYVVGDTIGIRARGPVENFEIVGIAKFGSVDSIGGATVAYFSIEQAQRLFEKEGKLDGIQIAGDGSVSAAELIERLEPILPAQTQAVTGVEQAESDSHRCRGVHELHPVLPACIRRHCPVRGRVRHLQHALDHGGPADAGVCDATHPRWLSPAGTGLGRSRDVHHRLSRLTCRAISRACTGGWP